MKYEKNIAVAIRKLLADFEDIRMELGDRKGETLLPHCYPKTNIIISHRC